MVDPDPRLRHAMDRVDASSHRLEVAVEDAKRRGVFDSLRNALVQSADGDADRIRRLRRRR
jgi:hypothetical protein